jgi:hypothetical protein
MCGSDEKSIQIVVENLEGKRQFRRIMLKWILKKRGVAVGTGPKLSQLSVVGSCEHGDESSGCIKGREFLDSQINYG